jgi:hypothetical protein
MLGSLFYIKKLVYFANIKEKLDEVERISKEGIVV